MIPLTILGRNQLGPEMSGRVPSPRPTRRWDCCEQAPSDRSAQITSRGASRNTTRQTKRLSSNAPDEMAAPSSSMRQSIRVVVKFVDLCHRAGAWAKTVSLSSRAVRSSPNAGPAPSVTLDLERPCRVKPSRAISQRCLASARRFLAGEPPKIRVPRVFRRDSRTNRTCL
jgi:hypothetical protein